MSYAEGYAKMYAEGLVEGAFRMGVRTGMSAEEIVDAVIEFYGAGRKHVEELIRAQVP